MHLCREEKSGIDLRSKFETLERAVSAIFVSQQIHTLSKPHVTTLNYFLQSH